MIFCMKKPGQWAFSFFFKIRAASVYTVFPLKIKHVGTCPDRHFSWHVHLYVRGPGTLSYEVVKVYSSNFGGLPRQEARTAINAMHSGWLAKITQPGKCTWKGLTKYRTQVKKKLIMMDNELRVSTAWGDLVALKYQPDAAAWQRSNWRNLSPLYDLIPHGMVWCCDWFNAMCARWKTIL